MVSADNLTTLSLTKEAAEVIGTEKTNYTVLSGYVAPRKTGYGLNTDDSNCKKFQDWIKKTTDTKDNNLIKETIDFLRADVSYAERLDDGIMSEGTRTADRQSEGISQLEMALKELN